MLMLLHVAVPVWSPLLFLIWIYHTPCITVCRAYLVARERRLDSNLGFTHPGVNQIIATETLLSFVGHFRLGWILAAAASLGTWPGLDRLVPALPHKHCHLIT